MFWQQLIVGMKPEWESTIINLFLAWNRKEGQNIVTPVLITYYSDLDLPESFFDYSKLYELRVRRSVPAEMPLKSIAYRRYFDPDWVENKPPELILRLLDGVPRDILKMDMLIHHYDVWGNYRIVGDKDKSR
jgi:hypothetical protein